MLPKIMAHLLYFPLSQLKKKKGWNRKLKWGQCEVEPLAIDTVYLSASDVFGVFIWPVPLTCIYTLYMSVCMYVCSKSVRGLNRVDNNEINGLWWFTNAWGDYWSSSKMCDSLQSCNGCLFSFLKFLISGVLKIIPHSSFVCLI